MPATIFARVVPKTIRVTEKYYYDATISNNPRIQITQDKEPTGALEILVPYDGEKYFTQAAAKDVKRQHNGAWRQPHAQVRIGYLGFSNPGRSKLDDPLGFSLRRDVTPLNLPITGEPLPDRKGLLKNELACKLAQAYTPSQPLITPVNVTVSIFDEQILGELNEKHWDTLVDDKPQDAQKIEEVLQKVAEALGRQEIFSSDLTFNFDLELRLLAPVGRLNDDKLPTLMRCALAWPVVLDAKQLSLKINREKQVVVHNPEPDLCQQGAIEWRNVPFKPPTKNEQLSAFIYKTPRMRLSIAEPGELYNHSTLNGIIEIKIPRALSGLELKYFSVDGQKVDEQNSLLKIDYQTILTVNFKLELTDCFNSRAHIPYRHLHFEGIALTPTRLADIEQVLEHFGFESLTRKVASSTNEHQQHIIIGRPRYGSPNLRLWLLVEGEALKTTRNRKIAGDHTYSTAFDNGALTIYMRGVVNGKNPQVIELMNHIQQRLKEHFQYMSIPA